ncbi:MAG: MotA/TolQ/ExbB proton channel family protein [Candidatus Nealsonbacteria bacterium]|nr:MotA/TolQ/ExbB proton channel family protein [Candidatus Nealsonbacteria bacterium]
MNLLETILKGQVMMVPLIACSVIAMAVFTDRLLAFYANGKIDVRALRSQLRNLLREHKLKEAAVLCADTPGPISAVLLAGIQSYNKLINRTPENTRITVGQAMDDFSRQSIGTVDKRLWILATIAAAAPLLGMTGTVVGMIKSFQGMGEGESGTASVVAVGISEALITTAAGLIIALGAVIPYSIFAAKSDKIELDIEEAATEMLDLLATEVDSEKANA